MGHLYRESVQSVSQSVNPCISSQMTLLSGPNLHSLQFYFYRHFSKVNLDSKSRYYSVLICYLVQLLSVGVRPVGSIVWIFRYRWFLMVMSCKIIFIFFHSFFRMILVLRSCCWSLCLMQVLYKFCLWATIEGLGYFMGPQGLYILSNLLSPSVWIL